MAEQVREMNFDEAVKLLTDGLWILSQEEISKALEIVRAKDPNHPVLKKAETELKVKKAEDEALQYASNLERVEALKETYDSFIQDKENESDTTALINATEIEDEKGEVLSPEATQEHFKNLYENAQEKAVISIASDPETSKKTDEELKADFKDRTKTIFFTDFAAIIAGSQMDKPTKAEQKVGSQAFNAFITRQVEKAQTVIGNILTNNNGKLRAKSDAFIASALHTEDQIANHIKDLSKKLKSKYVKASEKATEIYQKAASTWQTKLNSLRNKARTLWETRYDIMKSVKNSLKDNKYKLITDAGMAFATLGLMPAAGAAIATYAAYHAAGSWVWPVVSEMRKMNRERKEAGETKLPFIKSFKLAWRAKTGDPKKSWREKLKNPATRTYFISGAVNTIGAIVGASVLSQIVKAHNATQAVADTVNGVTRGTRRAISLGRAGMAAFAGVTDGTTDKVIANRLAKKLEQVQDPEEKAKLQTQIATLKKGANMKFMGAGIGVGAALIGQAAMGYFANNKIEVNPEEVNAALNTGNTTLSPDEIVRNGNLGKAFSFQDSLLNKNDTTNLMPIEPATDTSGLEHANALLDGEFASDMAQPEPFPTEWNKDMGITQKQFKTLVSTMEGSLKTNNITLDNAYINLDESMSYFDGMTKEQVLYKFNRLYAFMRKAVNVGDGTYRETPSGEAYLQGKFTKLGFESDKVAELTAFAQEHTYDSKSALKEALENTFGDDLNAKQTKEVMMVIGSNARFYQHGEEMEAMLKALSCGEALSEENASKMKALFVETDALFKTGNRQVIMTGMNLENCNDDNGQWHDVAQKVVEEKQEYRFVEQPTTESTSEPTPESKPEPVVTRSMEPVVEEQAPEPTPTRTIEKVAGKGFETVTGENKDVWRKTVGETTYTGSHNPDVSDGAATVSEKVKGAGSANARVVNYETTDSFEKVAKGEADYSQEAFKTTAESSQQPETSDDVSSKTAAEKEPKQSWRERRAERRAERAARHATENARNRKIERVVLTGEQLYSGR